MGTIEEENQGEVSQNDNVVEEVDNEQNLIEVVDQIPQFEEN